MPQTLKCPSCAAPLQYDGRSPSIKCDYCGNITLIPEEYRQEAPSGQQSPFGSSPPFAGYSQSLPLDKLVQINEQLQRGRKIEAIKIYRETFGGGLKEAKDAVERLERGEAINVAGQQTIMAYHGPIEPGQVFGGQAGASSAPPGTVVLGGGRTYERPKEGCVGAFLGQFGCLLFILFWIPFLIVMVGTLIFPQMVAWTAPIACDEGYQEAYAERVSYYSTSNFEGNNIVILHCVYGDGQDEVPHPLLVDGIIFAVPMAFLTVAAFVVALIGRLRALA
jgi:LSD1 subclass zinc finger protein